jgi:glycosyltransferase involved in cell wall biosynthesis
MKVYFIEMGNEGCYYVRCLLPLVHNGWYGVKTSLRSPRESNQRMLDGALASDVVVFQRPIQKEMLEAAYLLKEKGTKIVLDSDDSYRPEAGLPKMMAQIIENRVDQKMEEINQTLQEFGKLVDLVTVSTPFLAKEYEPLNKNVKVIPNFVDPADWPKPKRNKGKKVRIGLVGSVAMNDDTKHITAVLRRLGMRKDVQLVVFGIPPNDEQHKETRKLWGHEIAYWRTMNIEWQPFVPMADYFDTLNNLELDLMLIPRADNYFNRAKSNLKFLEASMLEIPVIAQAFPSGDSPYQRNGSDVMNMALANSRDQWEAQLDTLISNKPYRRRIGKNARKYVLANYNINKNAHLWKEAYEQLWN